MEETVLKNKTSDNKFNILSSDNAVSVATGDNKTEEWTDEKADAVPDYVLKQSKLKYKWYLFFKRAFDIVFSGLAILLLIWLYLILAIIVKCSDGGSVFYRHCRVGKNGKPIKVAKFRSMRKDADNLVSSLTPEQRELYKKEYKMDGDPRITRLGGFLRRTSLDELPNLFSVFCGKISLVGPRPLMETEVYDKYGENAQKLLSVKPGMVGWWAVNGRNSRTYDSGERQQLELYYVDNCSVWLDIKILFKAIGCVFKRTGAQ